MVGGKVDEVGDLACCGAAWQMGDCADRVFGCGVPARGSAVLGRRSGRPTAGSVWLGAGHGGKGTRSGPSATTILAELKPHDDTHGSRPRPTPTEEPGAAAADPSYGVVVPCCSAADIHPAPGAADADSTPLSNPDREDGVAGHPVPF